MKDVWPVASSIYSPEPRELMALSVRSPAEAARTRTHRGDKEAAR